MGEIETVYICVHARMPSRFSCVRLFVTPGTVGHQAPLSMDSPGQDTGVGCHALPPGALPDPGVETASSASPAFQVGSIPTMS